MKPISHTILAIYLLPERQFSLRDQALPVFLISFNRGAMLRQTIASLRRQSIETIVIVHDNGSSDPETLDHLSELESENILVKRNGLIMTADELNEVDRTVQEYFSKRSPTQYVVSDCDVDLSVSSPDALRVYGEMLKRFPDAECAGPMLRIRDIPKDYPLYNRVMNRHIEQIWHREPSWCETTFGRVAFQFFPIDTTLALHRSGEPFRRLKPGLRLYEPYEALHLDWYHKVIGPDVYATTSSAGISHWNNIVELGTHRDTELAFDHYFYVSAEGDGRLSLHRGTIESGKHEDN